MPSFSKPALKTFIQFSCSVAARHLPDSVPDYILGCFQWLYLFEILAVPVQPSYSSLICSSLRNGEIGLQRSPYLGSNSSACQTSTCCRNSLLHYPLQSDLDWRVLPFIFRIKSLILCLSFAMRPSLLLFFLFVACSASLTNRDCGDDPEDCDLGFLHVNSCRDPENAEEQIGIDLGLLDSLRFFSQFAAASYWPGNTNSTGDLLKCSGDKCPKVPAGNCPDVEEGEYMTISEWKDIARFDDHGKNPLPKK